LAVISAAVLRFALSRLRMQFRGWFGCVSAVCLLCCLLVSIDLPLYVVDTLQSQFHSLTRGAAAGWFRLRLAVVLLWLWDWFGCVVWGFVRLRFRSWFACGFVRGFGVRSVVVSGLVSLLFRLWFWP